MTKRVKGIIITSLAFVMTLLTFIAVMQAPRKTHAQQDLVQQGEFFEVLPGASMADRGFGC